MTYGADRFDGLAEAYEMHRPGYPAIAFQALLADLRCPTKVAVDVGAGPGNSTTSLRAALGPGAFQMPRMCKSSMQPLKTCNCPADLPR